MENFQILRLSNPGRSSGKDGGGGGSDKQGHTSFIVHLKMNQIQNNTVLNMKHFRLNTTVVTVDHNLMVTIK